MGRPSFANTTSSEERLRSVLTAWAILAALAGCDGVVGEASGDASGGATGPGAPTAPPPTGTEVSGLPNVVRRLTPREYVNVVTDVLGLAGAQAHELLPVPARTPDDGLFDNEWEFQDPSEALVVGAERLARDVAEAVVADADLRNRVVGCESVGADDSACFEAFIRNFGLRAFRRPVEEEDVQAFMALLDYGTEANDFYFAVELALSAFLQHPQFLYRVEIGQPVVGDSTLHRLDGYEVASRLSFFLWASAPDIALLQRAEVGQLDTPDELRDAAQTMLADPRARSMAGAYHEMWLGYEEMGVEAELEEPMRTETTALIERVLFEGPSAWTTLFTAEETFASDALAEHYGIPAPGSSEPAWTSYGDTGRRGILTHGTILSPRARAEETDPVKRGLLVRRRLLCQVIAPPPQSVVAAAEPEEAAPGACKPAQLAAHATIDSCAGCHRLIDPIGFAFEQYDQDGRFRTHEEGRPECATDGRGELSGPDLGQFTGPGELGTLLAGAPEFQACMLEQLLRFVTGRVDLNPSEQDTLVEELNASLGPNPAFEDVVLAVVSHPSFVYRREGE